MNTEQIEFVLHLGCGRLSAAETADAIKRIIDLSHRHHRRCEDYCNGPPPCARTGSAVEAWQDRVETDLDRTEALLLALAEILGVAVTFQRDPRGCTVKIGVGPRERRSWIGVPT